jgi:hypothetical protein
MKKQSLFTDLAFRHSIFALTIMCLGLLSCRKNAEQNLSTEATATTARAVTPVYSQIWGANGEKWDHARIPDFRSSGYKMGIEPPNFSNLINVKSYGAKGDGSTDDIKAFRAAIKACPANTTLLIPAGTYILSDTLIISKNNINFKGAGRDQTFLSYAKGLEELYPNWNTTFANRTKWSWDGGMVLFENVTNSGIEHLTMKFPDKTWGGHNWHERGYNGVGFYSASNCWLTYVNFIGADMAIWIGTNAHHITADNFILKLGPNRNAQNVSGHHGVNIYGGYNLLQNFSIEGKYRHDLSVESPTSKFNVFRAGAGEDLCIDHHSDAQRNNLFTNLDAGVGTRLYFSGGSTLPAGICFNETYWNIRAVNNLPYCNFYDNQFRKSLNNVCIGYKTNLPSSLGTSNGNWFETISPDALMPKDLYLAQEAL